VLPELGDLTAEQEAAFRSLAPLVQERTKRLEEAAEQVQFLLVADDGFDYDEASWDKQMTKDFSRPSLDGALGVLEGVGEWDTDSIEAALRTWMEAEELSARKVLQPIRVALTGSAISPPLFESMDALGRESTLARIRRALTAMD
jgi:glutamyl-tRNA synthetase